MELPVEANLSPTAANEPTLNPTMAPLACGVRCMDASACGVRRLHVDYFAFCTRKACSRIAWSVVSLWMAR